MRVHPFGVTIFVNCKCGATNSALTVCECVCAFLCYNISFFMFVAKFYSVASKINLFHRVRFNIKVLIRFLRER